MPAGSRQQEMKRPRRRPTPAMRGAWMSSSRTWPRSWSSTGSFRVPFLEKRAGSVESWRAWGPQPTSPSPFGQNSSKTPLWSISRRRDRRSCSFFFAPRCRKASSKWSRRDVALVSHLTAASPELEGEALQQVAVCRWRRRRHHGVLAEGPRTAASLPGSPGQGEHSE